MKDKIRKISPETNSNGLREHRYYLGYWSSREIAPFSVAAYNVTALFDNCLQKSPKRYYNIPRVSNYKFISGMNENFL